MTLRLAGREISRVGLGTNRLTDSPTNVAFIKAAVAGGLQMIDTAHSYTGGQSEETIGAAVSGISGNFIVATKGGIGGPGRGRPDVLRAEIEESFKRLRTERITLYYLHRVDPDTPIEESLAAINEYREHGRIEHIGVSETSVEQIERARKVVPVAAVQNHYNIEQRKYDDVVDYCEREGIPFVPFFPLRVGVSRTVGDVAARHRVTPQQILVAWLLRRSPVMLPIPGTLSLDHLKQNIDAASIELTDAEYRSLS